MPTITPDIFSRARQIILPLVEQSDQRDALMTDAFFMVADSRLYHQIDQNGSALNFTTLCIKTLIKYECLPPGDTHALSQLLVAAKGYCGVNKHGEIDALVAVLNTVCGDANTPPPIPLTPAPPVTAPTQTLATPRTERRATVFISYSHVDTDFAKRLIAHLTAAGHPCWIDTSEIKGGDEWIMTIAEGINNSYAFMPIVTARALQSQWVQDEILWARQKNKLIIPVILENVLGETRFFPLVSYQGVTVFDRDERTALDMLRGYLPAPMLALPEPAAGDPPAPTRAEKPTSARQLELAYLDRLRFDAFRLEKFELAEYAALGGVAHARDVRTDAWESLAMKQEFAVIRDMRRRDDETADAPAESFTDAVTTISQLRRAVVLGEPGAGKTHTLRAIAKPLYTAALTDPKAPLPLLVKLGNWDDPHQPFDAFLRETLGELGTHLDELMAAERAVLLFDGLNEFPANQRAQKYPQVEQFIKAHPALMAVVTCREADYPVSLHLSRVLIRPLDPLRIRDFARRALHADERGDDFFWRLAGGEALKAVWEKWERAGADFRLFWEATDIPRENPNVYGATSGADNSLWREAVRNPASIMRLASNPYMLRMLLDVYIQYKGALPTNRGQLFAQFVDVLLEREQLAEMNPQTGTMTLTAEGNALLTGLQRIAFEMQVQREGKSNNAGTTLPAERVREVLSERLMYLAVSTSILSTGDEVRFTHQLLQEYFAAKHMDSEIAAERLHAADIWKPERWWERTNWEESAILLAGLYSDDYTHVVEWVNAANPEVAAQCVMRSGAQLPPATRERLRDEWLARLTDIQREPNPLARAAIGRALGLTGWDTRKGVGVIEVPLHEGEGFRVRAIPDIDWVDIPAGEFIYQDSKMTLDYSFQMARYPITYKQFQAFIDDPEGFYDARWWQGLAHPADHNVAPGDQTFKYGNHPRERVSWYDAIAFCRWLSWRLGGGYDLDKVGRWALRLPTEFEWEYAARGTDGREYPYLGDFDAGNGNTSATGIKQTSAVGIFPDGASPFGVLDMSGNVWNWCLTDYNTPAERAAAEDLTTDARRVLRGGSWNLNHNIARAAYRNLINPSYRDFNVGFRLVGAPSTP